MTGEMVSTEAITATRCGYTILVDGCEEPCDRPATGHRWYQDVDHEDCLDVACALHENEGGRRIDTLIAEVKRLTAIVEAVEKLATEPVHICDDVCAEWGCDSTGLSHFVATARLRSALAALSSVPGLSEASGDLG